MTNIKCKICNKTPIFGIIHHINGNDFDDRIENRLFICWSCHGNIHFGIAKKRSRKSRSFNQRNDRLAENHKYDGFSTNIIKERLIKYRILLLKNKTKK